ncbi:MAG TPA: hypothetical protein PLC91_00595 [Candidatus Cloacimonadota bacterium]|nr:hypothetical protein [Candidatus Cloacimonadota bacterium]HQH50308.1 hypothetical protein [Candidatus Cloacimonadota bacterium]
MKRNYINNSVLCAALLLLALPLFATDMNNSGAAFIRMGIGGRVLAMGEAGAAITDDIGSVYWNPAGLAHLRDFEVGTTYNFGLDFDRTHTFAAFGTRLPLGTVAFSWVNAAVSDIEGYVDADTPTGTFSDSEHSLAFSYSNYIGRLSFGVTPKIYFSTIDGETEQGYGLDAGLKLDLGRYLQLGTMVRDITGEFAEDKVPWQVSAGLAANPLGGITLAAEVKMEQDEKPYPCLGAEYWTAIGKDPEADSKLSVTKVSEKSSWEDALANLETGIRLGYSNERLSAGTGFRFRNLQLDYVFRLNRHDLFSDDHIISMILRF